jgi:hypothetical protein
VLIAWEVMVHLNETRKSHGALRIKAGNLYQLAEIRRSESFLSREFASKEILINKQCNLLLLLAAHRPLSVALEHRYVVSRLEEITEL